MPDLPAHRVAEALQYLFETYDENPSPETLAEWISALERGCYPEIAAAVRAHTDARWR